MTAIFFDEIESHTINGGVIWEDARYFPHFEIQKLNILFLLQGNFRIHRVLSRLVIVI